MDLRSVATFQYIPGQWIEFTSPTQDLPSDVKGPFKILLKKNDPDDHEYGMCYLMSTHTALLEYRPSDHSLGLKHLPDDIRVTKFSDDYCSAFEKIQGVGNAAFQYLKSLVTIRSKCLTYNPATEQVITSDELRSIFAVH